jgi:hypothetical protein
MRPSRAWTLGENLFHLIPRDELTPAFVVELQRAHAAGREMHLGADASAGRFLIHADVVEVLSTVRFGGWVHGAVLLLDQSTLLLRGVGPRGTRHCSRRTGG